MTDKLKTFTFIYTRKVTRAAYLEATDNGDAYQKIDNGDFTDLKEIEAGDITNIRFFNEDDLPRNK